MCRYNVSRGNCRLDGRCRSGLFKPSATRHSPAMTRMRHIATTRTAPQGARLAVQLRGLLLLTLR